MITLNPIMADVSDLMFLSETIHSEGIHSGAEIMELMSLCALNIFLLAIKVKKKKGNRSIYIVSKF